MSVFAVTRGENIMQCPNCGAFFEGQPINCPRCGALLAYPAPGVVVPGQYVAQAQAQPTSEISYTPVPSATYVTPTYYDPTPPLPAPGGATASMVLGIISLLLIVTACFCIGVPAIGSILMSIVGIVLSVYAKKIRSTSTGTAGLIMNIIALILGIIIIATYVVIYGSLMIVAAENGVYNTY
jgi:hypothetical protein